MHKMMLKAKYINIMIYTDDKEKTKALKTDETGAGQQIQLRKETILDGQRFVNITY